MFTLMLDTIASYSGVLAENYGKTITDNLKDWIEPVLFLIIGFVALTFLFKRQLTQLFQFIVIIFIVGALWYRGDEIIESVGNAIGRWF